MLFYISDIVFPHPSMSMNNEKNCREISEDKIALCEKTMGLLSENFLNLNSACLNMLY